MFQIREHDDEMNNSFEIENNRPSITKKPKSLDDFDDSPPAKKKSSPSK